MSISAYNKNYSLYFSSESEANVKEAVSSIVQQEQNSWSKENNESSNSIFKHLFTEPDWDEKNKLYLKIEKWLCENSAHIPTWEVAGALHFGMSPNDMKETITEKLKEMAKSGRIKLETSIEHRELYFPNDESRNNLTRIWGAQFLQKQLEKDNDVKAAEHFLIFKESVSEIKINIWLVNSQYPYVSSINFDSGYVLSERIIGEPKATNYKVSSLIDAGFRDFSDPGNIIEDKNKINWVVDTEAKSFDSPSMNREEQVVTSYLKKRFDFLYSNENQITIKIPVSDIF